MAINVLLSFNIDYVFYSVHFRFHQVSKKATFLLRGKVQRIVRCASPFELFSFAAIRRKIKVMRKMEMAREIVIWRKMEREEDGDKAEGMETEI